MASDQTENGSVVVRLLGGLGNQMFQYAAALALAHRQGRELLLDLSSFITYKDWPYQLDRLQVPQSLHQGEPVRHPVSPSFTDRLLRKLAGGGFYQPGTYREPHFHFDPAFFKLTGEEIMLEGYFQSPLYFSGAEDLIRERFRPTPPLTETALSWSERLTSSPMSVSVHVRRGDYVRTKHAAATHGALDLDYYKRAIPLMRCLYPNIEFFVFSDDPDYVEATLGDLPNLYAVRSDPSAPWEDMFLMAMCNHHIIANSSYSWWGAWLNPKPGKTVIAPARWFAAAKLAQTNVLDVFPDDWILLK